MSEMVERVARAMAVSRGFPPDELLGCGAKNGQAIWRAYEEYARAALEAMREPTEAMKRLFCSARPESPRTVWHEVIDAALGEGR